MNKINEISLKDLISLILYNKFKLLIFNIVFLIFLIPILINLDTFRTEYRISIKDNPKLLRHDHFEICSIKYETIYFPETFMVEFLAMKKDMERLSHNFLCYVGLNHTDEEFFRPQDIITITEIYNSLIEKLDFDEKFLNGTSFVSKKEFIKYYEKLVSNSKVYKNNNNSAVNLLFKHKNNFNINDLIILLQNLYRDYYKNQSFSKYYLEEKEELDITKISIEFENYINRLISYVEDDKLKLISKIQGIEEIVNDSEFDYKDIFKHLANNKFENLILFETLRKIDKKIQIEVINGIKDFSFNPKKGFLGVNADINTIVKLNNDARDELIKNNLYIENIDYFKFDKILSEISINAIYISLISIIIYNFILLNLFVIFLYKKE